MWPQPQPWADGDLRHICTCRGYLSSWYLYSYPYGLYRTGSSLPAGSRAGSSRERWGTNRRAFAPNRGQRNADETSRRPGPFEASKQSGRGGNISPSPADNNHQSRYAYNHRHSIRLTFATSAAPIEQPAPRSKEDFEKVSLTVNAHKHCS